MMRSIVLLLLIITVSGCATTSNTEQIVNSGEPFDFLKSDAPECIYQSAYPDVLARVPVDKQCLTKKYPKCISDFGYDINWSCVFNSAKSNQVAQEKTKQEAAAEYRRQVLDKYQKYLDSPEGKAEESAMQAQQKELKQQQANEQKAQEAYNKKLINSCNYFLSDILNKKNLKLKEISILNAVETMPNVVMCTFQVTNPGVYVDLPKILTITGNTQNGAYEY